MILKRNRMTISKFLKCTRLRTISRMVSLGSDEEPTDPSLARMMEQEIARVVGKWRRTGVCVLPAASTKPCKVAEMEHAYLKDQEQGVCACFCEQEPCVWLAKHEIILTWDSLAHGDLDVDNILTINIRRKRLYHQMANIINGGRMGGGVRIEHPRCVVDGIHTISPDPDGNHMGHREVLNHLQR
jgi:hypothetical protein